MKSRKQWILFVLAIGVIVCLGAKNSGVPSDDILFNIKSDSNDVVLITNEGNVGIGTSSPQAKLHIGGKAGKDGIMFPDGTVQKTAKQHLGIQKYDSGWFAVSQMTTYTKAHALAATPDIVQVWYSDTPDGSGNVVLIGSPAFGGDRPVYVIDIDETNITLRAQAYVAIYSDASGVVRAPRSGYVKIIALKFS